MNVYPINNRRSNRGAWTIVELLAFILIIFASFFMGQMVAKNFGVEAGIGAGILSGVVCIAAVILLYRFSGRRHAQRQRELRDKYRGIYRVLILPKDERNIKKPQGAEIKVGDYGWEAEPPNCQDGLIYLQGLTDKWRVVWYAGFRPDQIESVGPKSRSQYDWDYSWTRKSPPCPFPVQERETTSMGLPDVSGWNGPKRK